MSQSAPALLAIATLCTACMNGIDLDSTQQPIIGGQLASSSQYPAVVGLETGPGQWFCTGTLIDPEWVLTAAHCVTEGSVDGLQARFGADDISAGAQGTAVSVSEIHAHPGFNDAAWNHDIAVLKLSSPVTDRPVTPVHRQAIASGTTVIQAGYGDADDNGGGAGRLRMLSTQNVDCSLAADPEISGDRLLCFDATDHTTSCYGDSGGPTFLDNGVEREVVGVTSGGTADLCTGGWDLHTLVPAELDFVDQYVPVVNNGGTDPGDGGTNPDDGTGDPDDSGTGNDPDTGNQNPDGTETGQGGLVRGGCAAGGSGSSGAAALLLLALALIPRRRRR